MPHRVVVRQMRAANAELWTQLLQALPISPALEEAGGCENNDTQMPVLLSGHQSDKEQVHADAP